MVLFGLSWSWNSQFLQAALHTEDAKTNTVPSQTLRFLHYFCLVESFHLFIFRQEEILGVQDVILLSKISKYMYCFYVFDVKIQVMQHFCHFWYCLIKFLNYTVMFSLFIKSQQYPLLWKTLIDSFFWSVFPFMAGVSFYDLPINDIL